VEITGIRTLGKSPLDIIIENSINILTSVKNINISYSANEGSVLPGYTPVHYGSGNAKL
jgi:hypothetical protein